jgi:hypothetical protein
LAPGLGCPAEGADEAYNKSQQPHNGVPKSKSESVYFKKLTFFVHDFESFP